MSKMQNSRSRLARVFGNGVKSATDKCINDRTELLELVKGAFTQISGLFTGKPSGLEGCMLSLTLL